MMRQIEVMASQDKVITDDVPREQSYVLRFTNRWDHRMREGSS
jgi:hypothetical protein